MLKKQFTCHICMYITTETVSAGMSLGKKTFVLAEELVTNQMLFWLRLRSLYNHMNYFFKNYFRSQL